MYIRVTRTVQDRGVLVRPSDLEKNIIDRSVDWYCSSFTFGEDAKEYWEANGESIKGYTGDARTSTLYWDLDCKTDFDLAKKAAVDLAYWLDTKGYGKSIEVYFSGNKGFHILLRTSNKFSNIETSAICYNMAKEAKVPIGSPNGVLDLSVYNITRIFRIVNTKHQESGLYKIPLTIDELVDMSSADIRKLAAKPRFETFESELADVSAVKEQYTKAIENNVVDLKLIRPEDATKPTGIDFNLCPPGYRRCVYAIEQGSIGPSERHEAILRLAAYYKAQSYSRKHAGRLIFSALERRHELYTDIKPYDEVECNRDIDQIYSKEWKGGTFSCKTDLYLQSKCDHGDGPCYDDARASIRQVVSASQLANTYIRYGEEALIEYPKFGLSWLDARVRLRPKTFSMIAGANGCVDADTEFLSPTGWMRIADWNGQQVMQYDKDTGEASFVTPSDYIKLPCNWLWHFKHDYGLDQMLSEEHRVLYKTTKNNWSVKTAGEIARKANNNAYGFAASLPTTFKVKDMPGLPLTEAQLKVMVAVIADGSFPSNTTRCIMRLKRTRKIERLRELLNQAGIEFKEHDCNGVVKGFKVFTFYAPKRDKTFTFEYYKANQTQLDCISKEVIYWDGNAKSGTFSTTIDESAKFIQYAYSATGYRSSISINDRVGQACGNGGYVRQSVEYSVTRTKQTEVTLRSPNFKPKAVKNTDGYKYCFTVPTGFLVLRRGASVFITGNSGKTSLIFELIESLNRQKIFHAFFSLDMADSAVFEKLGAKFTPYSQRQIEEAFNVNTYNSIIAEEVVNALKDNLPYTLMDFSSATIDYVEKTVMGLRQTYENLQVCIVDYAGKLIGEFDNQYANATANANKLNDICKRTSCHFLVLSQVSRENGDHTDPLRTSRVSKDSGAWEENATTVLTMWRPFGSGLDGGDDYVHIYIAKNRSGPLGENVFYWSGKTGKIWEMENQMEFEEYRQLCEQNKLEPPRFNPFVERGSELEPPAVKARPLVIPNVVPNVIPRKEKNGKELSDYNPNRFRRT